MKIVFNNPNKLPVYNCSVCSKQGVFSNRWQCIEYGVGIGLRGYEAYFITCSQKCREKDKTEQIFQTIRKQVNNNWREANFEYLDEVDKSILEHIQKLDDGK